MIGHFGCSPNSFTVDQHGVSKSRAALHGFVRMTRRKPVFSDHKPAQKSLIDRRDHSKFTPMFGNVFKVEIVKYMKALNKKFPCCRIVTFKSAGFDNAATLSWFVIEA
jgi:hypothetical protein